MLSVPLQGVPATKDNTFSPAFQSQGIPAMLCVAFCCFPSQGVPATQYDAFQIGLLTTDDFQNADVLYNDALPRIRAFFDARANKREVPIVTGAF